MGAQQYQYLPLNENATVRVVCRHPVCGIATEIPFAKIESFASLNMCPHCKNQLIDSGSKVSAVGCLKRLAHAIADLSSTNVHFSIEIVVPVETPASPK
jgi:hypothetical protein